MALRPPFRRRALSMTSLIDVIFLLLLFFMLSSTFSKFSEVELASSAGTGGMPDGRTLFLQVTPDGLRLNARDLPMDGLATGLQEARADEKAALLLSLAPEVTSQRLTDVLVILRAQPDLSLSILTPSS